MSKFLLLPNKYKAIGWFILIPATILSLILIYNDFDLDWIHAKVFSIATEQPHGFFGDQLYFQFADENITKTLIGVLFLIGAMLVSFSKEKNEDEFINKLRLSSLLWAVWVNYSLLFLAFIFVYGTPFLNIMFYNMFTVLIIFIIRFNYILYKNKSSVE